MFAQTMRSLRLAHQMTQAQLADRLGVSPSAVGMYEQGRREPDMEMLLRLCGIFQVSPDRLLGWQESQTGDVTQLLETLRQQILSPAPLALKGTVLAREERQQLADAMAVSAGIVLDRIICGQPQ